MDKADLLNNYDDVLVFDEFREVLRIGKNKAYELLKTEAIVSFKVGKDYRIPKMEVIK